MKNIIVIVLSLIVILIASAMPAQKKHVIRLATVAPRGTPVEIVNELNEVIKERSNGRLEFRIYAGSRGDESQIIRSLDPRRGTLDAAGLTGFGLGRIVPMVRILEIPYLFKNYEEVDYVVEKLYPMFQAEFEKAGYVLLGWAEIGFVYIFSKEIIASRQDLKKSKIWLWLGDPLAEEMFKALGVKPIPLSLTQAVSSLQVGLINAVYAHPEGALLLRWYENTNYMNNLPIAYGIGGVVITQKKFNSLDSDLQDLLLEESKKKLKGLIARSRSNTDTWISRLQDEGIEMIPEPVGEELEVFMQAGKNVQKSLTGKLYSSELLNSVLGYLNEIRKR